MIPHANIQAVTFDVGGTLIAPWPSVGDVYATVAAQHGFKNLPVEILGRQFAAAWRASKGFDHSREAWRKVVNATFAGLMQPTDSFFRDLYQRFASPEVWRIFGDVVPALRILKERGLRLGIISNWDERLRPLLRDLELAPFFDVIVI